MPHVTQLACHSLHFHHLYLDNTSKKMVLAYHDGCQLGLAKTGLVFVAQPFQNEMMAERASESLQPQAPAPTAHPAVLDKLAHGGTVL